MTKGDGSEGDALAWTRASRAGPPGNAEANLVILPAIRGCPFVTDGGFGKMEAFQKLCEQARERPWYIAGYAGEHDEAGASICSSGGNKAVASTRGARNRSPEAWAEYLATARLVVIGVNHVEALVGAVNHLTWCRTCAEDGLNQCDEGRTVRELLDQIEREAADGKL